MGLFRSIYKVGIYSGRVERFIKRTKDQKKLARLALESPSSLAREEAMRRITDPDTCMALIDGFTAHPREVSLVESSCLAGLVEKVNDQSWLKQLYLNKESKASIRSAALRQIEDQDF